jgi:ABC-2 type transport system ATP-binding protein
MVEGRNLYKIFGDVRAVDGLDLHVDQGEIYGLVGPDGAGKTTAVRLLCGALKLSQAPEGAHPVISIAGVDLLAHPEQARAHLGYLPQRFSLYDDLTVLENLRFFAEVRGISQSQWLPQCMEILQFVGLDAFINRRAGHLSGGMRQKLGLAAALVHQPRVLLLDEPTTGVDPVTRQDFWQLIIRLVTEEPVAVLVTTPYMDEATRCSRVGLIHHGKLLLEGTPAVLRERMAGRVIEVRGQPLPLLRSLSLADPAVQDAQMFGDRLHLHIHPGTDQQVIPRLQAMFAQHDLPSARLRLVPPQLEDVFIALLEEQA